MKAIELTRVEVLSIMHENRRGGMTISQIGACSQYTRQQARIASCIGAMMKKGWVIFTTYANYHLTANAPTPTKEQLQALHKAADTASRARSSIKRASDCSSNVTHKEVAALRKKSPTAKQDWCAGLAQ